jgi:signal transduction histidine kinase
VRLPALTRTTTFRLTVLFVVLFAVAATAFLTFVYLVTSSEVTRTADTSVAHEVRSLDVVYGAGGPAALKAALAARADRGQFAYELLDSAGRREFGDIDVVPVGGFDAHDSAWMRFRLSAQGRNHAVGGGLARGERHRLPGGELLFVGEYVGEAQAYVLTLVRALWGAGALVVLLGLVGGLLVSRNVSRSITGLNAVVAAVRGGDLRARVRLRGAKDEFEDLAVGLNDMLDRLERSIGGLRHAGDSIAHDLRSPLTRLRTRLEVALLDVEAGKGDPTAALVQALEDADGVLRTFNAVLAIARLQAAGAAPDQAPFDPSQLAADVAELYGPLCEEHGLDFQAELAPGLSANGNREFIAQAISNVLDNAVKYTPPGGAVMLRVRRRSSGETEFSVTDTGPGVAEADRQRVVQRFVRLENSRNQPGAGLGLSLVAAVAEAHGGRLELEEGPGKVGKMGPGLRVAVVLPRAA